MTKLLSLLVVAAAALAVAHQFKVAAASDDEAPQVTLKRLDLAKLSQIQRETKSQSLVDRCGVFDEKLREMLVDTPLAKLSQLDLFARLDKVLSERKLPFGNDQPFLYALRDCIEHLPKQQSASEASPTRREVIAPPSPPHGPHVGDEVPKPSPMEEIKREFEGVKDKVKDFGGDLYAPKAKVDLLRSDNGHYSAPSGHVVDELHHVDGESSSSDDDDDDDEHHHHHHHEHSHDHDEFHHESKYDTLVTEGDVVAPVHEFVEHNDDDGGLLEHGADELQRRNSFKDDSIELDDTESTIAIDEVPSGSFGDHHEEGAHGEPRLKNLANNLANGFYNKRQEMVNEFIGDELIDQEIEREQDPLRKLDLQLQRERKLTGWLREQLDNGQYEAAELRTRIEELESELSLARGGQTHHHSVEHHDHHNPLERARLEEMKLAYERAEERGRILEAQLDEARRELADYRLHRAQRDSDDDDDDSDSDDDDYERDSKKKKYKKDKFELSDPVEVARKLRKRFDSSDNIELRCQKYFMLFTYPGKVDKKLIKTVAKLVLPPQFYAAAPVGQDQSRYVGVLRKLSNVLSQSGSKDGRYVAEELQHCLANTAGGPQYYQQQHSGPFSAYHHGVAHSPIPIPVYQRTETYGPQQIPVHVVDRSVSRSHLPAATAAAAAAAAGAHASASATVSSHPAAVKQQSWSFTRTASSNNPHPVPPMPQLSTSHW